MSELLGPRSVTPEVRSPPRRPCASRPREVSSAPAELLRCGLLALGLFAAVLPLAARAAPALVVEGPGHYDFGARLINTTSESITIGLRVPPGSDPVTIRRIESTTTDFLVDTSVTRRQTAAGEENRFGILFHPMASGARRALVTVYIDGAGADPVRAAQLTMTGVGVGPEIELLGPGGAPPPIEFGTAPVGDSSAPRELHIRNRGAFPLELLRVDSSDPQYVVEAGPVKALPPGGELTLRVRFHPAQAGPAPATLRVRLRSQPGISGSCALRGIGEAARGRGPGTAVAAAVGALLVAGLLSLWARTARRRG